MKNLPEKITSSFGTIVGVAGKVGSAIFNIVTVAILTIYFMLVAPPDAADRGDLVRAGDARSRRGRHGSGDLADRRVRGRHPHDRFDRRCVRAPVLLDPGLLNVGIPFALPLAVFSGLAGLIPAVGAYIGAAPAVIVGFFQSGPTGVLILVYFIVYQQIENYVIQPRIMKNAVNLSPTAVILATLVRARSAGSPAPSSLCRWRRRQGHLRGGLPARPGRRGATVAQETLEKHDRAEAEAEPRRRERAHARSRSADPIASTQGRLSKKPPE